MVVTAEETDEAEIGAARVGTCVFEVEGAGVEAGGALNKGTGGLALAAALG